MMATVARWCSYLLLAIALTGRAAPGMAQPIQLSGDGITMTSFPSAAGAFCSLKWQGREFIDANDHGRCLQSASSHDERGEGFNPTEAGSSLDGTLPNPSTSVLLTATFTANSLSALTQMAYWNPVGGKALSAHTVRRDVSISDGIIAMGNWSPDLKPPLNPPGGYGRWRFGAPHNVTKWNMVRRVIPVAGTTYTYQTYITVGTLQDVQAKLKANTP